MRAPAASAMAVAWGTPTPSTAPGGQAGPGPAPPPTRAAPRLHRQGGELTHSLWGEAGGGHDAAVLHLLNAPPDQFGLDGLGVDLLHAPGGLAGGKGGDLLEAGLGVLVAGPQPPPIEHRPAARA